MLPIDPVKPINGRRLNLPLAWLITLLIGAAVAAGGVLWGKSVDCKPGQIDGQCGLGTFLGVLYGAAAGLAIFLGGTVYVLVVAHRRNNSRQSGRS